MNGDGQLALEITGITYSSFPAWVTSSVLDPQVSGNLVQLQLNATGATSYYLDNGSTLPAGLTLSSTGLLEGTITVAQNTTFTFTINAEDNEKQTSPRTFSLLVNNLLTFQYNVTWSSSSTGYTSWDYGRTPSGILFNKTDINGADLSTAQWPSAPGTVRITYVGTTTNIDGEFTYSSVILPGQTGGFASASTEYYQLLYDSSTYNYGTPYSSALGGESIIATIYLLPA